MKTSKSKPRVVEFGDVLKQDDQFKRYQRLLKSIRESIDLDRLEEEARTLHAGRISRTLLATSGAHKIADTVAQEASYRSRLVEIRVGLTVKARAVEKMLSTLKGYISREYAEELVGIRTKIERSAFLESYLASGVKFLADVSTLIDVLDLYIKDIDQAHFQVKLMFQCLELVTNRKNDI